MCVIVSGFIMTGNPMGTIGVGGYDTGAEAGGQYETDEG